MKSGEVEKWPVWQGTLLINGCLPHTVNTMGDSVLGTFHRAYKRVGTVIDYQSDPHALHVGLMADRNIPVVYGIPLNSLHHLPTPLRTDDFFAEFCAKINPAGSIDDMKHLLRKYLPPDDYIQRIRDREEAKDFDHRFAFLDDGFGEPYADTRVLPDFPLLDRLARQHKFETREQFFAWQELEIRRG